MCTKGEQPRERCTDGQPSDQERPRFGRSFKFFGSAGPAVLLWCYAWTETLQVAVLSHMSDDWRTHVTVIGRVARVRALRGGGWRVRLTDTGGALAAAEIRPANPMTPPPVGALIVLHGQIRYDEEHDWYVVDPLEEWFDARVTSPAVWDRVQVQ